MSDLLFIIAGSEFGDLEGHMLVIYKTLYGLLFLLSTLA
jgi:hypothetical protein